MYGVSDRRELIDAIAEISLDGGWTTEINPSQYGACLPNL